ncbi:MAG: acyltransferase [bacterium]|nr:acyltransferase [bacterium]
MPASPIPRAETRLGYVPELEGLRGIAVLLVYVFHADRLIRLPRALGKEAPPALTDLPLAFVQAGHTGVSLFFVLSGFLLARPFLVEGSGGPRVDRRRYAARRALRILPLYLTAVLVGTLATMREPADLLRAVPYLTFATGVLPTFEMMPPFTIGMWSLATEAQFYLLLPFLPLALKSPRGRAVGGALLLAYVVAYATWTWNPLLPREGFAAYRLGLSVFGRGWLFLAGIGAAWLYYRHGATLRARLAGVPWLRRGGADVALLAVLVVLALVLQVTLRPPTLRWDLPPRLLWHAPEGACWAAVLLLVLVAPLRLRALVTSRPLVGLGIVSYSIYLSHMPILTFGLRFVRRQWRGAAAGWEPSGVLAFAALSLVVILWSTLCYRVIERPFLRWKGRVRT